MTLHDVWRSPLTPVVLVVLVVVAAGFWAMRGADVPASTEGAAEQGQTAAAGPAGGSGTETGQAAGQDAGPGGSAAGETGDGATAEPADEPQPDPAQPAYPLATSRSAIDRSGGAADTMRVTVYYVDFDANMEALQPVEIQVPFSITPIKVCVEQLLHPPEELGLFSEFPPGTAALGFNLEDGVAVVDLSAEVEGVRGETAVNAVVATLVYTLTEIPGVVAVQLRANGEPAVLDGFEWSAPLTRADVEAWQNFRVEPVIPYSGG